MELVTLVGEPGIGKSRLVRELAAGAGADTQVLVGHCPAYGDGVTYWPLREMVLQALRGRALTAVLAATEDGRGAAATIAATLGLGGQASADAAPWAFRMLFTTLARRGALVLAFEDAHWAEPALLDLIEQLAGGPMAAPVLLLCVGRPELLTARPAWARRAVLRPDPLDEQASRRLLGAGPPLPAAALDGVVARARGNPLFLEQLAAHVRERGEAGTLPPALHALLAARLDTLGATERRVIEAGAIEGETFHVGGLEALVPDPGRAGLDAALELLSQRELVRPAFPFIAGQRAFRFGHALVRDAAYAAMPLAARAEAHERLAGWLADLGVAVPEASARIGTQLERAWRAASELRLPAERLEDLAHRAAARLAAAAHEVHGRGDLPSEIAFLERALALLAPGDGARAELLPAMGVALFEAGSLERAEEVADEAVGAGRDRVRLRGEVERQRMRAYRHPESVDPSASLIVAEDAAMALEALGDDVGVARARYLMCELAWLQGRSERGLREARDALRFARRAGGTVELDAGVSVIAWALVVNRVPVPDARAECEELLRSVAGRRFAELGVRGFAAVLDAMAGDFERARDQLARSRDGLNDLGLHQASIWMAVFDAQAQLLAGDPIRAEAALADAECVAREIGDRWFLSTILVDRAHVLLAPGAPRGRRRRSGRHRGGAVPERHRVEHQAAGGPRQARRSRGAGGARAGAGARRGRAGRADRAVPLPHRRLARSGGGRRSGGRAGRGRRGARDRTALLPRQGQRRRRRSAGRRRVAELRRVIRECMMSDPTQVHFFSYDDADALQPVPGIEMRAVYGAGASVNLVHLAAGAELPLHSHPHEQIGIVLEGVQVLIVGGREHRLGVNEAYVVPGGVEHGGRGGPDGCRVLDVFVPGREDYRSAAAPARERG